MRVFRYSELDVRIVDHKFFSDILLRPDPSRSKNFSVNFGYACTTAAKGCHCQMGLPWVNGKEIRKQYYPRITFTENLSRYWIHSLVPGLVLDVRQIYHHCLAWCCLHTAMTRYDPLDFLMPKSTSGMRIIGTAPVGKNTSRSAHY